MGMPQCVHADARDEIEIAGAVHAVDVATFAFVEDQRVAAVILQDVLAFQINDGVGGEGG
jgi:hypothetical protein